MTQGEINTVVENYKLWVQKMKEEEDKKYLELAGGRGNDSSNAYSGSQSMDHLDNKRAPPNYVKTWSEIDL